MISWKVQNTNRLLTEVKNKFSGRYTVKDIRWSIDHNRCFLNKIVERFGSTIVKKGDTISIQVERRPTFVKDRARILYEDGYLLVYDKPPSITSEQLASLCSCLLVHRLDRDTSGLILLAKSKKIQEVLEEQFRKRFIAKEYLAIVEGNPGQKGVIKGSMAPLAKREGAVTWGMTSKGLFSQTQWSYLKTLGPYTLLKCIPITGRTHQIRVHLAHLGYPIIGDPVYGSLSPHKNILRPLLHAHQITFTHPISHLSMTFCAPPPLDFNGI